MKIKGIDLYKKVLEKDKNVLDKKFKNEEFGEVKITYGWGRYGDDWAMETKKRINFLSNKEVSVIDIIMLAEWEEVRQTVTWQEAIEARADGKDIYFIYEGIKYEIYYDILAVSRINGDYIDTKSDRKNIKFDMLENGEWFIED